MLRGIRWIGSVGLLATVAFASEPKRPNFLFLYSDDQRFDALGVVQAEQREAALFPFLKTPNLDRLASEGSRFRNMFVVQSLCSPSRASFLTGCYGFKSGIVNNHLELDPETVTHATLLRSHGYTTGYVGKWHMGDQAGRRPGFDYSASFVGQGKYVDCPFQVNGVTTRSVGWVDDVTTNYALEFLEKNKERPFSLVVGFKSPHGPFTPPPRRAATYEGEHVRPAPNLASPAIYLEGIPKTSPKSIGPAVLDYLRCVTAMDDDVGRILHALDELGLADDTIVIFASDNGYYLGEHGLVDKQTAYEESIRVPLVVRGPKLGRGRTVDSLALNVDLAPTLLDFAGVEIPAAMQGRSWRPLLEGRTTEWRTSFFYANLYESNVAAPAVTAVRTETAKLVRYPGHPEWTELFDLAADPYERKNLANDLHFAELRRSLEAEHDRQAQAIDFDLESLDATDTPPKPPLNAWVFDCRFKTDAAGRVLDESGKGNHGVVVGELEVAQGRDGAPARRFDGKSWIEVANSPTLDPCVLGWSVEVTIAPEKLDGVVLARGGAKSGYALHLEEGRPVFTVVSRARSSRVVGPPLTTGRWATITAKTTADKHLTLRVDDQPPASADLAEYIRFEPGESMQIGADRGAQVTGQTRPGFVGRISSVRLFSGVSP